MRIRLLQRPVCCSVANRVTGIIRPVRNTFPISPLSSTYKKEKWVCETTVPFDELLKSIKFNVPVISSTNMPDALTWGVVVYFGQNASFFMVKFL
jgi:hypothetical protein